MLLRALNVRARSGHQVPIRKLLEREVGATQGAHLGVLRTQTRAVDFQVVLPNRLLVPRVLLLHRAEAGVELRVECGVLRGDALPLGVARADRHAAGGELDKSFACEHDRLRRWVVLQCAVSDSRSAITGVDAAPS